MTSPNSTTNWEPSGPTSFAYEGMTLNPPQAPPPWKTVWCLLTKLNMFFTILYNSQSLRRSQKLISTWNPVLVLFPQCRNNWGVRRWKNELIICGAVSSRWAIIYCWKWNQFSRCEEKWRSVNLSYKSKEIAGCVSLLGSVNYMVLWKKLKLEIQNQRLPGAEEDRKMDRQNSEDI